jgi:bifunctional DNA-binding transcriptional regulator/antitoxin component of YhaV-PrlF toxin-antitoxin module
MRKEIIITTTSETFAFGVTSDTYDQVYIPASLQKMFDLKQDDIVTAILRPNEGPKASQVPYFAVYIIDEDAKPAEPDPVVPHLSTREMTLEAIKDIDAPATTEQIVQKLAEMFGEHTTTQSIGTELHNMHKTGLVARCCIKQIASQERASLVFWAKSVSTFQNGV